MRDVDRQTTERYGIPSILLMENAGRSVVEAMQSHYADLSQFKIAIFCGKGNNGGDGLVAARHLMMRGCRPDVLLFANPADIKGDARINLEILQKLNLPVRFVSEVACTAEELGGLLRDFGTDLVIDGLLGTGARLPVSSSFSEVIRSFQSFPRVVAIDIPSGLDCEEIDQESQIAMAPHAELTVTFTAPKIPHILYPGAACVGKWVVVPIGSPAELLEEPRYWLNAVSSQEAAQQLTKIVRSPESHKGNFGHVLVIAGSLGKTGAAVMAAKSALLAGAGLVTLATPAPCLPIVAAQSAEVMTEPLEATESGGISIKAYDYGRISELLKGKDVLALGPGIGTDPETKDFVRRLLKETTLPVVLDADGINAFAGCDELLNGEARKLILTPHPGEFARLIGRTTSEVLASRIKISRQFSIDHHVHLVLKGHRTVYAAPSGQVYVNLSGNPGMATGGSGDVLTGILVGLIGQGMQLPGGDDAARDCLEEMITLGVYLHGNAGDLAAVRVGQHSLIAGDIMDSISNAFLVLRETVMV